MSSPQDIQASYDSALTNFGIAKQLFQNFGFPTSMFKNLTVPKMSSMADGIKYNGQTFLLDNFDTAFMFGFPISMSNPNGIFLFKVATISNRRCKLGNSIFPFCANLGFARLWLLNHFGSTMVGLSDALKLMFVKLRILNDVTAAPSDQYKYGTGDSAITGSLPYICQYLTQQGVFDQEYQQWQAALSELDAQVSGKIVGKQFGYVVPTTQYVQLWSLSKRKLLNAVTQMQYFKSNGGYNQFIVAVQNLDIQVDNSTVKGLTIEQICNGGTNKPTKTIEGFVETQSLDSLPPHAIGGDL